MASHSTPPGSPRGIALLEVLLALSLLTIVSSTGVQLLAYTAYAGQHGRRLSSAGALAAQKLEQLASLAWTYDALGTPLTDTSTDVTSTPESSGSGTGLAFGPAGTLDANTAGYCDFIDAQGRQLGGDASPPAGTAFVRRWAIRPLADDPLDTLVVIVRVISAEAASRGGRDPSGVTLTAVRTRLTW